MNQRRKRLLFPFLLVCLIMMSMSVSAGEPKRSSGLISNQIVGELDSAHPVGIRFSSEDPYSADVENTRVISGGSYLTSSIVTEASNSELNPPQKWSVKLNGKTLTAALKDSTVSEDCYWQMQVYTHGMTSGDALHKSTYTTIQKGKISIDLSDLGNGWYDVYLMRADDPSSSTAKELIHYTIIVSDSNVSFYSTYYDRESTSLRQITSVIQPEWYNRVPAVYYTNSFNYSAQLSKIVAVAKSITKNVSDDEAKLEQIHNWICTNISYDYDAAAVGYVSTQKQNNPFYVYKYKRGVCGGYARLMEIMLTSVGVPCIYIEGHAEDGTGNDADNVSNHAWNLVWIGNAWRYVDVTWDCRNIYENQATSKNQGTYAYYGSPMYFFANDHWTHSYGRYHLYVKKLSVYEAPKKTFTKGSKFSVGSGRLKVTFSDGSTDVINMTSSMCSGYNMNKYGKQKIKVSYCGADVSYTANVIPKKGTSYTVDVIRYRITKASASSGTVYVTSVTNAKNVVIPKKVKIKGYKFKVAGIATGAFKKCSKLRKLTIETLTLKTVQKNALTGIRGAAKIYVPAGKYAAYKMLLQKKGQSGGVTVKKIS